MRRYLSRCAFFFRLVKVQQGIVGGIGYGDRGFQRLAEYRPELFQNILRLGPRIAALQEETNKII